MKKIIVLSLICLIFSLTGCRNANEDVKTIKDIRDEISIISKYDTYDNLKIKCNKVDCPDSDDIETFQISPEAFIGTDASLENIDKLKHIFEAVLDNNMLDEKCLYILTDDGVQYDKNYADYRDKITEFETCPLLYYKNKESGQQMEITSSGCIYASQGVICGYTGNLLAFAASDSLELVKSYDCVNDDLSDTYQIKDGTISVAEAKKEIEEYFDKHYPLDGSDNGIKNKVVAIDAMKVIDEDVYAFHANRTFSYNGIPFRMVRNGDVVAGESNELEIMGEAFLIEGNKVDVTLGLVNMYSDVEEKEAITQMVSFKTVMDNVSSYLTEGTIFDVIGIGMEYRLFADEKSNKLKAAPYWSFTLTNESDLKTVKIYVDICTGEVTRG